jgi:RNA polymerase sigma-70 factor (ECF subfamily)
LFKILFHCVNHDRRRWLRFPLLQDSEVVAEANLAYVEPIPERLTDDDVLLALDRLPADFRAIVLIVDVEEFSYKEASQILSIPVGTVMSRLSRGRKLLRDQLGEVARSYGIKKAEG